MSSSCSAAGMRCPINCWTSSTAGTALGAQQVSGHFGQPYAACWSDAHTPCSRSCCHSAYLASCISSPAAASPCWAHSPKAQQLWCGVCDGAQVLRGAVRLVLLQRPADTQVSDLRASTKAGGRVACHQAVAAVLQCSRRAGNSSSMAMCVCSAQPCRCSYLCYDSYTYRGFLPRSAPFVCVADGAGAILVDSILVLTQESYQVPVHHLGIMQRCQPCC
jgi:hypothetical protein